MGSVLWLLCYRCLHGEPDAIIKKVWQAIVQYYGDNKVHTQFSGIGINSFTDAENPNKDYPKLKGKGMEVKDLAKPLRYAWGLMRARTTYEFALV